MGVVKGPEEQKLLMAPVDIPMSRENSTNFDQQLEVGYLSHLPAEERIPQLQKEVVTALSELKFAEVGANYEMRNGRLVDSDTGLDLEELIAKGQILAETEAIRKLNKYLIDGEGLVINISPENKFLGYLDNMVDIWKKYTDGKVRVLRYKTEGDLKTFKNFYKNIGGEIESPTRNEILADSVLVKKLKLSEILDLLVLEKCETKCEVRDVDRVAGALMKDFEKKFGDQLTRDQHVIIRYYLAVKTEVEELRKNATMADINKIADRIVAAIPINISFKITAKRGVHCGSTTPGGEFDIGKSWILEVQGGKLTSHFGSVQGMTKCMQCGCWHTGSQCPYCDLGYAATC